MLLKHGNENMIAIDYFPSFLLTPGGLRLV